MATTTIKPRTRRMAREPKSETNANAPSKLPAMRAISKLDQLETLLIAPDGATIAEMVAATGWQQHSVRGAMAAALKKRGLAIASDKADGVRTYRASKPA